MAKLRRSMKLRAELTFVAFCILALPLAAADDPAPLYREVLDDPPADYRPREDPLARSGGGTFVVGPYVSVQVNTDELGQNIVGDAANEPSITVNATDPNNIVIGWRQFDSITSNFRQAGWAYSQDGGQSWTFPGVLTPGTFRSDPVLDTDSEGNLYYQSLQSTFFLDTFKSPADGVVWGPPVFSFGGDKNWMAIDRNSIPGQGHVYGIWQRFFGCCDTRTLTRSVDGAESFEDPVDVALFPVFGTMAVGAEGELYMTGIDGTFGQDLSTFVVATSQDAKDAAETPTSTGVVVDMGGSMLLGTGPNPSGLLGQANVAVDVGNGTSRGNVYVLASVNPPGSDPMDVHLIRSTDGGSSWSPPVRVNDDGSGAWQWFGAHSVAPTVPVGRIDVIWNDTRASGQSNVSELYYAYSYDEGHSWSPNVVVSPSFNSHVGFPNQNKIGDYYTIVSDEQGANVAYSATFNGEQDLYFVRVFPDCNDNGRSDVADVGIGSSPDCDSNGIPDECEASSSCTAAGRIPDGRSIPGMPLLLDKADGSNIRLTWDPSCRLDDVDYAIYEGDIGEFTGHSIAVCSTDGLTTKDLLPDPGGTYYLVVPNNFSQEGSYGKNSENQERPPASFGCFPQVVGGCLVP